MKTKTVTCREEWFPSLPDMPSRSYVNDKPVSRGEFIRALSSNLRIVADETHSAGGLTVRHVILEIPAP